MPRYPGSALITGASAGIGAAFARLLAQEGMPLVLVARRRARLDALAAELGVPCVVVEADLSRPEGPAQVQAAVEAAGVEVGLLVLNAGVGTLGPLVGTPHERLLQMVDLNCRAVVDLSARFVPGMRARGRGGVVVVASTGAFQAVPWMAVYGATKSFDLHFAEALWGELRGSGVHVTALCPGPTRTEFAEAAGQDSDPPSFVWEDAVDVARAGLWGLGRRPVVVSGWLNWLGTLMVRLGPRALATWVAGQLMRQTSPRLRAEL